MSKIRSYSETKETKIEINQDLKVFRSLQDDNWKKTKNLISKNIKEVVWKAWIEPLKFIEYEKKILHLSTDSQLISNRAETQYYENIFFEASKYFEGLTRIIFHTTDKVKATNSFKIEKNYKPKVDTLIHSDLSLVDSMSMKINTKFTFDTFVVGTTNQMP